jgi:hypothetical protein
LAGARRFYCRGRCASADDAGGGQCHRPARVQARHRQPRADCLDQAGDFVIPIAEGYSGASKYPSSPKSSPAKPARERDDEIAVYKSIGVPIQDLVTAQHIAQRAAQLGLGTEIDIGGD